MHKDCVYRRWRAVLAAMAVGTIALPSSAGEVWYARAVRGFDLPVTLPEAAPIALEADRIETHPRESCVPLAQRLLWTLQIDEHHSAVAALPISLYRSVPLHEAHYDPDWIGTVVPEH